MTTSSINAVSRWPHRLAVALALATFPLIWVGGLVTTYDAGMAVPDWPGTYGYNLFAYPWQTWLVGPWDLFIEHGHRLLGALVGLLTLALAAAAWLAKERPWFKQLTLVAVALVVLQGVLGGARVLWDERLVALLHGCTGPAFFGLAAALAVCSSRHWKLAPARKPLAETSPSLSRGLLLAAWWMVGLTYAQLIVGAVVRHIPLWASPELFRAAVLMHLALAVVIVVQASGLSWSVLSRSAALPWLRGPSAVLVLLVVVQILFGAGTWVAKYAWPAWADSWSVAATHLTAEKSFSQSMITTAHVANGSLILVTAVVLAVRSTRLRYWAGGLGGLATFSTLRAAA